MIFAGLQWKNFKLYVEIIYNWCYNSFTLQHARCLFKPTSLKRDSGLFWWIAGLPVCRKLEAEKPEGGNPPAKIVQVINGHCALQGFLLRKISSMA